MKFNKNNLDNILFLDIETVPSHAEYHQLSEEGKELWDLKSSSLNRYYATEEIDPEEMYHKKSGIFAEFAKIICISVGYLKLGTDTTLRIKSFSGDNEKDLLQSFASLLNKHFSNSNKDYLCGHNIKEFDIPFICRRMVIHGIEFPSLLDISNRKPWELHYLLDTMHMWKFGDFKNYTSLRLLAYSMGIPSPKDDIDGSQVASVYYDEGDLDRITRYCEKDVVTTARVFLKLTRFDQSSLIIEDAN